METIQLPDFATAKKAIFLAKAIAHKDRAKILEMIIEGGEGGRTVTNLYTAPVFRDRANGHMDQSICSAHLAWLRKAGLVTTERSGKLIFYKPNNAIIMAASMAIVSTAAILPETKAPRQRKSRRAA